MQRWRDRVETKGIDKCYGESGEEAVRLGGDEGMRWTGAEAVRWGG